MLLLFEIFGKTFKNDVKTLYNAKAMKYNTITKSL